jgi:DNA-binding NarL/FixJ family response regulator
LIHFARQRPAAGCSLADSTGALVEQIRVVLSGMPRMLRQIVLALVQVQPDMVIVAETETTNDLYALSRFTRADVIILGAEGSELPAVGRQIVNRSPHIKVLAVSAEGRSVWLYELRPHEQLIGEVSPEELVSAIRDAMRTASVPMEITAETAVAPASPSAGRGQRT